MGQTDPVARSGEADGATAAVLRAKYFEYCSAQLADLLLYLSPDEIYLLARKAASAAGEREPSYGTMVEFATRWLEQRVKLPPFDVWVVDYQNNPDHYEALFVGLWESEVRA